MLLGFHLCYLMFVARPRPSTPEHSEQQDVCMAIILSTTPFPTIPSWLLQVIRASRRANGIVSVQSFHLVGS
ncbi:hypothetical protein K492DRAFT_26840 [Lichtheimia hyalospora FSU 10163]|nr:hypothetical protein K492DRAFT_26840 [Lichtheimia hyalospora FSU 10163]